MIAVTLFLEGLCLRRNCGERNTLEKGEVVQVRRMPIAARAAILGLVLRAGPREPARPGPGPRRARRCRLAMPPPRSGPIRPSAFVPGNIHLTFSRIARNLSKPVFITHSGDNNGRLFIVQQGGLIRVIRNGVMQTTPFLDLRSKVSTGGERGLLGLAFHPRLRDERQVLRQLHRQGTATR